MESLKTSKFSELSRDTVFDVTRADQGHDVLSQSSPAFRNRPAMRPLWCARSATRLRSPFQSSSRWQRSIRRSLSTTSSPWTRCSGKTQPARAFSATLVLSFAGVLPVVGRCRAIWSPLLPRHPARHSRSESALRSARNDPKSFASFCSTAFALSSSDCSPAWPAGCGRRVDSLHPLWNKRLRPARTRRDRRLPSAHSDSRLRRACHSCITHRTDAGAENRIIAFPASTKSPIIL